MTLLEVDDEEQARVFVRERARLQRSELHVLCLRFPKLQPELLQLIADRDIKLVGPDGR